MDLLSLAPLFLAIWQVRQANYSSVATLAAFAYDIILDFGREVEYIWSSKWSLPKALYILVRYWGPIQVAVNLYIETSLNAPKETCVSYLWFFALGGSIIYTTLVNIILVLRLYTLYNRNNKVLSFLVLNLVGEFVAELYVCIKVSIISVRNWFPAPDGFPLPGCLTTNVPRPFTLGAWIPCLTVAIVFFIMTMFKLLETRKRNGQGLRGSTHVPLSPLFIAFFRDGAVFFFLIAVAVAAATVSVLVVTGPLSGVEESWLSFVYSLAGSRLIINLREAARKKGGDLWEETISLTTVVSPNRTNAHSNNLSWRVGTKSIELEHSFDSQSAQ